MIDRIKRKIINKFTRVNVKTIRVPERIPVLQEKDLLRNKVALITGGSTGIGFGISKTFVAAGARVILTGRNEEKLINCCRLLGEENCSYIVWDASSLVDFDDKLKQCISKFGILDILVNNVGYHGNQKFLTITESDWDSTFDVNVKYMFFLSQAIAQYMIDNSIRGHILNISSASSMKPAWSPYEISKWAVRGFTRGLARELAPNRIVVNGIAPGPTATEMSNWKEGDSIDWNIPLGRLIMPEELGNLALFMCSDTGNCMLGETVFFDGGSGLLTVNK